MSHARKRSNLHGALLLKCLVASTCLLNRIDAQPMTAATSTTCGCSPEIAEVKSLLLKSPEVAEVKSILLKVLAKVDKKWRRRSTK